MLKYLLYLLILFVCLKANSTPTELEKMHSEYITPLIPLIIENWEDVSQLTADANIFSMHDEVLGGSEQSPSVLSVGMARVQTLLKEVKVPGYQVAYGLKLGSLFFRKDQNQFRLTIYSDDKVGDQIRTYLIDKDLTISPTIMNSTDWIALERAYHQRMEKEGGRLSFVFSMIDSMINSIKAKISGLFEQGSADSSES